MEAINLDLLPGAMPPIVHVSQGDIGRQFQISIYDDSGAAYALAGKDLFIVGHKGDGNVFRYPIPSSAISDNIVTITTEEQMTPVAGKVLCEISIEYDGTVLGTCNFIMDVEQGPADLGPLSESTLYIIQTLFQQAEADIAAASAAETSAAASAAAASTSETNAAASAAAASTSETNAAASEAAANTSEANAAASAAAASTSETNAAASAAAASASETNAAASEAAASTSETNAAASASSASASAANAASSESSAAASKTSALDSKVAAEASANSASSSATNSARSAMNAADSAAAASASENNAAASEAAASASEANAAASAAAASTSETNAAASEAAANTSEANAAASAAAASTSETNAAASATSARDNSRKIENLTVSAQSVSYTNEAKVVKTYRNGAYNLDFEIPKGQPTSGHEVIANPSGTSTGGDLTKLGIDGVNYDLAGGSEIIVNPYGKVASTYINTLEIDGQTYGINSVPISVINKYELSPSKLVDSSNNVLADFSGKCQTYNITGGIISPRVVFEVCDRYVLDDEWAVKFSPLEYLTTKYIQTYDANTGRYTMQATTQPPIMSKVTTPVDLGAVSGYINCLFRSDGLYSELYNKELPILVDGNAVKFYDLSIHYCVDDYVDGVIGSHNLKLYITACIVDNVYNKTITVDYSSSYNRPTYILEDTRTTTVYSDTSYRPIITPYPTFN